MTEERGCALAQGGAGTSRTPQNAVSELAGSQVLKKSRDTGKEGHALA